jgi:hypothetical protein
MAEEFPLYIREEAARLVNAEPYSGVLWTATNVATPSTGSALCRLLMQTMPEPVDPLKEALDEALIKMGAYHHASEELTQALREALAKRGYKIVEVDQ